LREADRSQNCCNRKIKTTNKSGCTGVYWSKANNMWRVEIGHRNTRHNLGYFKNIEDAIKARKDAELRYHGEYSSQHRSNHSNNENSNCVDGFDDIQDIQKSNDIEYTGCF
jgi:hypothetical protein